MNLFTVKQTKLRREEESKHENIWNEFIGGTPGLYTGTEWMPHIARFSVIGTAAVPTYEAAVKQVDSAWVSTYRRVPLMIIGG